MAAVSNIFSKWNDIKLSVKLPLIIVLFSLITGIILSAQAYYRLKTEFAKAAQEELSTRASATADELSRYFAAIEKDLSFNAQNPFVLNALKEFEFAWDVIENNGINASEYLQKQYIADNPNPTGSKEVLDYAEDGSLYSLAHKRYHPWLRTFLQERGYYDIFLFDNDGNLVYSVFKELDYATNLNNGEYKDTDLGNAFRAALKGKKGEKFFFDFKPYAPSHGAPASFISTPLVNDEGEVQCVLVYQMPIEEINAIMGTEVGLGKSGKMFFVGEDHLVRNQVRGIEESTILKMAVKQTAVESALKGQATNGVFYDESGKEMFVSAVPMQFKGVNYAIVTQIEEQEADAAVYEMRIEMVIVTLITQIIIAIIAFFVARLISMRVSALAASVVEMSQGNDAKIPSLEAGDELGDIARSLKEINDVGQNALRVKAALDSMESGAMIADKEYVINYYNPAAKAVLNGQKENIMSAAPNANIEQLIGLHIDKLIIDNEHQSAMQQDLETTHEAVLNYGSAVLLLKVTPIKNNEGQRSATFYEWKDITQERAVEREVEAIVDACASGDFSSRLPVEGKQGFMLELAKGMNQICETADKGLSEVKHMLGKLSEGDLTEKMTGDYNGIFDEIKTSLNNTIEKLYTMVSEIQSSTASVNNASNEISSGSQDLAHRTEQQASTLEETAASMEEMTSTVRQNAENAKKVNQISTQSNKIAEGGSQVVSDAVKAMGDIQESSQKIADIIGVIDDIAFQTNLLALNAAVEAARAGEAGKGFAVVASEVRALAGRSAESSKEIKDLITASVDLIDNGFKNVNQSGETFKEIVESVKKTAELIAEISVASDEQARGIDEINSAVSQMDDTTQQNAALVEENTAAARSMSDQVEQLEKLVSFFKIASGSIAAAAHEAPKEQAPKAEPAPAPKAEPAAPAAPVKEEQPKNDTPAPAAPKASGSDDGWEEF